MVNQGHDTGLSVHHLAVTIRFVGLCALVAYRLKGVGL